MLSVPMASFITIGLHQNLPTYYSTSLANHEIPAKLVVWTCDTLMKKNLHAEKHNTEPV